MANTPISGLTNGVTAQPGDELPIARSGANYYITPSYIKTYILGSTNNFAALNNFQANLTIGQSSTTNGNIRFYNSANGNYVGFQSGATATNINYTLPATIPTTGQILSSTSSGVMSWVDNTAGSVNSGTSGQLAWYASTGSTISSNANLFWDSVNIRFGIGTSSPAQAYEFYKSSSSFLYVSGDGSTGIVADRYENSATAPRLGAQKSRGTRAAPLAVQSGDQVLSLISLANNGSTSSTIAEISTFVDTFTSASDISSYMTFSTSPSGGTASTERMRLDRNGNLGLGTTSPANITGYTSITINNASNGGLVQLEKAGVSFLRIGSGGSNDALINANGSGGSLQFGILGAPKLVVSSTGDIGIGTTSPTNIANYTFLSINNSTNGGVLEIQKGGTSIGRLGWDGVSSSNGLMLNANGASGYLTFAIAGSSRATLTNSGSLGLGTGSPAYLFEAYNASSAFIASSGDAQAGFIGTRFSSDASPPRFASWKARGSRATPAPVNSGDQVMSLISQAYNSTTYSIISEIATFVDTYTSSSDISSYMTFSTSPSGGTASTERMRIDKSGNVGIGTTSITNKLDVKGSVGLINGTSYTTTIAPNSATATNWTLTLPTTAGTAGYVLTTNGSGGTSWTASGFGGILAIANGGTNNGSAYTAGSLIFSDGTSLIQNNSKLFWDNTNQSLGVGTNTPPAIAGFTFVTIDNSSGVGVLQLNASGSSVFRMSSATLASGATNGLLLNNNVTASSGSGGYQFSVSADPKFTISNTGTVALVSGNTSATATNNLILGASTSAGTNATNTIVLRTGTAPTTGPTATVQFYSSDRSANNTIPSFYTEGSGVTNAGITNTTVTNKIAIRVNGTIYYLLATTNAT